jgi:hypothetical protein
MQRGRMLQLLMIIFVRHFVPLGPLRKHPPSFLLLLTAGTLYCLFQLSFIHKLSLSIC